MTPQEFKEQLDEFMDKIKELRFNVSFCDKMLCELDNVLESRDADNSTTEQQLELLDDRRFILVKRNSIRIELKEYEKIIQRLKSTL